MFECPICGESFELNQAVICQDEKYCSAACAEIAAREGQNTREPVEGERAAEAPVGA